MKSQPGSGKIDRIAFMDEVASIEVLQLAYQWLCRQRKNYPHNADVWHVRWRWEEIRPQLQERLLAGAYRLAQHFGMKLTRPRKGMK
jgi:hypothetical protein